MSSFAKLKQQGKKDLVVIVDNLDRIDNRLKSRGLKKNVETRHGASLQGL